MSFRKADGKYNAYENKIEQNAVTEKAVTTRNGHNFLTELSPC